LGAAAGGMRRKLLHTIATSENIHIGPYCWGFCFCVYLEPHPDNWTDPAVEPKFAVYIHIGKSTAGATEEECEFDLEKNSLTYNGKQMPGYVADFVLACIEVEGKALTKIENSETTNRCHYIRPGKPNESFDCEAIWRA